MSRLACQADPGSGPCPFVSVRTVHATVPDAGYPPESPMGRYCPGEPIVTFTCVLHLDGVHAAMLSLGLTDIHAEALPADVWAYDGHALAVLTIRAYASTMATKRLPPPLVGGIQQATVVDEDETDDPDEDDERDDEETADLEYWATWDGRTGPIGRV